MSIHRFGNLRHLTYGQLTTSKCGVQVIRRDGTTQLVLGWTKQYPLQGSHKPTDPRQALPGRTSSLPHAPHRPAVLIFPTVLSPQNDKGILLRTTKMQDQGHLVIYHLSAIEIACRGRWNAVKPSIRYPRRTSIPDNHKSKARGDAPYQRRYGSGIS